MTELGLSQNHWKLANYRQRMTHKEWRELLLRKEDQITFKGSVVSLVADDIGYGVVEVYKDPKELKNENL